MILDRIMVLLPLEGLGAKKKVEISFLQDLKSFKLQNILYIYEELKIGDVRYKHLTKTTIKVQLFWRLPLSAIQKRWSSSKSQFLEKSVQK